MRYIRITYEKGNTMKTKIIALAVVAVVAALAVTSYNNIQA